MSIQIFLLGYLPFCCKVVMCTSYILNIRLSSDMRFAKIPPNPWTVFLKFIYFLIEG